MTGLILFLHRSVLSTLVVGELFNITLFFSVDVYSASSFSNDGCTEF